MVSVEQVHLLVAMGGDVELEGEGGCPDFCGSDVLGDDLPTLAASAIVTASVTSLFPARCMFSWKRG